MSTPANIAATDTGSSSKAGAFPAWLIVAGGLLFYGGTMFLDHGAGQFNKFVYVPGETIKDVEDRQPKSGDDDILKKGEKLYGLYCLVCHQATGGGTPGQFPPLTGSEWVQAEGPNRVIRNILNGLVGPIEVKGQQFNGNMLAWRDVMTDDADVAAVASFVRKNKAWGNNAAMVTPEQVKKIREATAARPSYWTAEELQAIPDKD